VVFEEPEKIEERGSEERNGNRRSEWGNPRVNDEE